MPALVFDSISRVRLSLKKFVKCQAGYRTFSFFK